MTYDFSGRVTVIAGASKGIGAVTARVFASAGAAVVVAARNEDQLNGVAEGIRADGGTALAVPTDVGDEGSMRNLIERTVQEFGRLDFAFNNAATGPPPTPLADISAEDFDDCIRTNVRGTFLGMKYQIPAIINSGGGAVINMSSGAGIGGISNLAPYMAAKSGVIALTKGAALDYADQGVRVNVVAPGPILTYHLEAAGPEAQRQAGLSTPMRRVGQSEEVAAAVLWLCSEESSFITGVTVPIDGGQCAGMKPDRMYSPGKPMEPEDEEAWS